MNTDNINNKPEMSTTPWVFIVVDRQLREYTVHLTQCPEPLPSCIAIRISMQFLMTSGNWVCCPIYTRRPNWKNNPDGWCYNGSRMDISRWCPTEETTAYVIICNNISIAIDAINITERIDNYEYYACKQCGNADDIRAVLMSIQP